MTLKRIVLSVLTVIVAIEMGASLIESLNEPQVGNRLQLYQTDLLVQASEWDGSGLPEQEVNQFRAAVFGQDALSTATEQYQEVRQDAAAGLQRLEARSSLALSPAPDSEFESSSPASQNAPGAAQRPAANSPQLAELARSQQALINQIDLRLGLVQAERGQVSEALTTWQSIVERAGSPASSSVAAASALQELWQSPPVIRSETEALLNRKLNGWFRNRALERLYGLKENTAALNDLQSQERAIAERTLIQLSLVGLLPSFGGLLGTAGLIALVAQRLLKGKDAILALPEHPWQVPWDWEVVWQVIVGGFLFVGQIVLPLMLQLGMLLGQSGLASPQVAVGPGSGLGWLAANGWEELTKGGALLAATELGAFSSRGKALYSLVFYLLMAASTLGVLYGSIKPYFPLPRGWFRWQFRGRWPLWGWGSYLVALPLMLGISLINQQLWQGQGGNNPILQLVLEERDPIALGMFLFTAAIAAPVFEEILFRGFLLPSLSRYLPIWGAIGLSSLVFAVAHLSFSEVLPLTVLGVVLGFAYVRSQNLLSAILLHSTWNSVTMIGLFLLGSSGS